MSFASLAIQQFVDPATGKPVSSGSLYIGKTDLDPEIEANRKDVRLRQENGVEIATSQPVSLGGGGVPLYNGSPVQVIVDGDYSLKVLDRYGAQVYYVPTGSNLTSLGSLVPQAELQTATDGQTVFNLTSIDYTPGTNDIQVYINGIRQFLQDGAFTETSSTSVTFSEGVAEGSKVLFITNEISASLSTWQGTLFPSLGNVPLWDSFGLLLADLQANDGTHGITVYMAGRSAVGDGGEGHFRYDNVTDYSTKVAADTQEGIYVSAPSGVWVRQVDELYNTKWFGAKGDGATDDLAALNGAKAVLSAGDILRLQGDHVVSGTFTWDKAIILDFTEGSLQANGDFTVLTTDIGATEYQVITDNSNVDVDVLSAARAGHTSDLVVIQSRFKTLQGSFECNNAGGRGFVLQEEAGGNLNFSDFDVTVGGNGGYGFELVSNNAYTNCNAMKIAVSKTNTNAAGAKVGGGNGNQLRIAADSNTAEALTVAGGSGWDIWLYDDSSNGARSVLTAGNGYIRGLLNSGEPDVTGNLTSWEIRQGRDYRYSQSDFVTPFRLLNSAANTSTEGFDIPFLGASGASLLNIRIRGDNRVLFQDASRYELSGELRVPGPIQQIDATNSQAIKNYESVTVNATSTKNLSADLFLSAGMYTICSNDGNHWIIANISSTGVVTAVGNSASFGTSLGASSYNLYVSGGDTLLQNTAGSSRFFTITYQGVS